MSQHGMGVTQEYTVRVMKYQDKQQHGKNSQRNINIKIFSDHLEFMYFQELQEQKIRPLTLA